MKVIVKGCLLWHYDQWREAPAFVINEHDFSTVNPEYALVRKVELEMDVPDDFDPRPLQVESLRKKKQEVLAEAQMMANNIDEQINRLLAIEFKPAA